MKKMRTPNTGSISILLVCLLLVLSGCNGSSGSASPTPPTPTPTPNYASVIISTQNYDSKTAVNVSIGGGRTILAEIDTGSDMTVVDESAVGPDITKTTESMTISYGGGENTISGYLAYGSITFSTTNGEHLTSSPNTPILVVTQSAPNVNGSPNSAILGMRMDNQVSSRLYLPSPYNSMMVLNRSGGQLIFGNLAPTELGQFSQIQQESTACVNYNVPQTLNNTCWDVNSNSVTYTYPSGSQTYPTIFDSGEANASFYFGTAPAWMTYDNNNGLISTPITVTVNTNKGHVELPLTPQYYLKLIPNKNTINPGNSFFNDYQVLFDQTDGVIGFQQIAN